MPVALHGMPRPSHPVGIALPGDMYRVFHHHKHDEWMRFISTVTEWDVQTYLDVLPCPGHARSRPGRLSSGRR
jgi:glutamine synthetase